MDFFMQELGVPGIAVIISCRTDIIYGVPISIHWYCIRSNYRSYTSSNKS